MNDQITPPRTAAPLIDIDTMNARYRDYGLNTLNPVVTMMMSGVFATAALAFADIVRTPELRWVRLSIWFWHAVFASTATVGATNNNMLYAHPRPALVYFQLIISFVLSAGFACLPLNTGGEDGWLVALASPVVMTALFAGWIFPRFAQWLDPSHYPAELAPHLAERFAFYSSGRKAFLVVGTVQSGVLVAAILTQGTSDITNAFIVAINLSICCVLLVGARSLSAINQRLVDTVERVCSERRTARNGETLETESGTHMIR